MPANIHDIEKYYMPAATDTGEVLLRWDMNEIEKAHLSAIGTRAVQLAQIHGASAAVHLNGCPLNFHALLLSDDLTFFDELVNLRLNVDRLTGKLRYGFAPKFAVKS